MTGVEGILGRLGKSLHDTDEVHSWRLTLAAVLAFMAVPFTEELVVFGRGHPFRDCGVLDVGPLLTDVVLYLAILLLLGPRRTRLGALWLLFASASWTFVLDLFFGLCLQGLGMTIVTLAYLIPQVLLLGSIARSTPPAIPWREALRHGMPLLSGVFAAWMAAIWIYPWLEDVDLRSESLVNTEYFAQVSQLIPLLAVAVLLQPKVFPRHSNPSRSRPSVALSRTLLIVLFLGEAAALLALLSPESRHRQVEDFWFEYYALLLTAYAVFAALASFAGAAGESSGNAKGGSTDSVNSRRIDVCATEHPTEPQDE